MYDVIVVGARCAGSPAAMLLARRGYRVLMLDKATFPSDTPSTHFLHTPAVARLKRWGLLDRVLDTGCPPITKIVWGMQGTYVTGPPPAHEGADFAVGPRRTVLDKILLDAAVEAGVDAREACAVEEVLVEDGRVVGVRAKPRGGASFTERAPLVIGADGISSIVAKTVQPRQILGAPPATAVWYSYWRDTGIDHEIFTRVDGREVFIIPTNDGNVNVMVGWRHHELSEFRKDVEGNYHATLDLFPGIGEMVRSGKRTERFYAFSNSHQWLRVPWGPGWCLLGDSSHLKDPVAGIGITDSFRSAEVLVERIHEVLSGSRPEAEAMTDYQAWRDDTFTEAFGQHLKAAQLNLFPADMLKVIEACGHNDKNRVAFFGLLGALTPMREFFTPENCARILADAEEATGRPWALERPLPV